MTAVGGVTVLHVDDEPGFGELTARWLEDLDDRLTVHVEHDPRHVHDYLDDGGATVDCIVSDYDMPHLDGLELLAEVRDHDGEVPFVLFTGQGNEEITSEAMAAGVTDYLPKSNAGRERFEMLANRIVRAVDRHRAERRAAREERRFTSLFDGLPIPAALTGFAEGDDAPTVLEANLQFAALGGRLRDELAGCSMYEVVEPTGTDPSSVEAAFRRDGATTHEVRRAGGAADDYLLTLGPVDDAPSDYDWTSFALLTPITEQKTAERVFRELAAVTGEVQGMSDPERVVGTALESLYEVTEATACVWLDYDRGADRFDPALRRGDDRPRFGAEGGWQDLAREVVGDGERVRVDDPERLARIGVDRDASLRLLPVAGHGVLALADRDGTLPERRHRQAAAFAATVGTALDRVALETERAAERRRAERLFEHSPDPMVRFRLDDGSPVVERVNGAFEDTFGYDATAVVGEHVDEDIVPDRPTERETARTLNEAAVAGKTLRREGVRLTADGPRPFEITVFGGPRVDDSARVGYAQYEDVSERRELERSLEQRHERLDALEEFIAHDMKSPMNVALGYLDLGLETGVPDAAAADLAKARDAMERIDGMLEALVDFAAHGKPATDRSTVAAAEIAADAWAAVDPPAAADLDVAAEDVAVEADGERLETLFENLFRNAVKFAGPDVNVTVGELDGVPGFYVVDDGPGFADRFDGPEEAFRQGATTAPDGHGLGLANVKRVVEAHNWRIGVHDRSDQPDTETGARFEVYTGPGSTVPSAAPSDAIAD